MRLLIVEDDNRVADALANVMTRHGFTVFRAATGAAALQRVGDADVVLLDLGLPDMDGFEVCRIVRASSSVPIIVVSARSELAARVHGLHAGADDYMVKPINGAELMARIHAVTRRYGLAGRGRNADGAPGSDDPGGPAGTTSGHQNGTAAGGPPRDVRTIGALRIDLALREVTVEQESVELTRKEFDLLAVLAREPGLVCRREQLIAEVWSTHDPATQRTLEVHVASLRSKLGGHRWVETVRGVGYRLLTG